MLILIPVLIAASDLLLILINYLGKLQLPIAVRNRLFVFFFASCSGRAFMTSRVRQTT
jgi:hypothetical protein